MEAMQGGNGVVIMINGENFSVITELLNSVAMVYDWKGFYKPTFKKTVTVPKDTLQQLVGNFLLEKDTLTISFCGDNLCLQAESSARNRLPNVLSQISAISLFVRCQMLSLTLSEMLQE
jgi:hypothetical protein